MESAWIIISKIMSDIPTYLDAFLKVLTAITVLIGALIGFFVLVPGEHPDKELQWISDKFAAFVAWITKYSRKKE